MLLVIIQVTLAALILGFLYIRMIRREVPKPIGTWQALVPVLFGVVSTLVSTLLTVAVSIGLGLLGARVDEIGNPVAQSAVKALVGAGLTEEIIKLLMMLLSFRLFRPKNGIGGRASGRDPRTGQHDAGRLYRNCAESDRKIRRTDRLSAENHPDPEKHGPDRG